MTQVGRTWDLIVVGGGAGGLTAARVGVERGATTLLIQDGPPGGDCTFTGCVPSKSLLSAAARGDGFDDAMAHVGDTVSRIAAIEDADALRRDGIEVVESRARFVGPRLLSTGDATHRGERVVISTGSRPLSPPIAGLDETPFLTNETLFDLTRRPDRLAIIGGGPIGVEMAQAFAGLGTRVSVIERLARLLPRDDEAAGAILESRLAGQGVAIHVGVGVDQVSLGADGSGRTLRLDDGTTIEVDEILVATGRQPVTDGLDPGAGGIDLDDRGHVVVDDTMATSAAGVFAVGDVTGRMAFTHAAANMAMIAATNALRPRLDPRRARFREDLVPWVTYTDPEVAHVGMTEAEAAAHRGRVAHMPLDDLDRAMTAARTEGFVTLYAGPRPLIGNAGGGRLLGATIVAPRAGEMINEISLAMRAGVFTGRLAQTVHAYPTWSMAIQEAAIQFFMEYRGREARPAVARAEI